MLMLIAKIITFGISNGVLLSIKQREKGFSL
jgi:hypothetical protein